MSIINKFKQIIFSWVLFLVKGLNNLRFMLFLLLVALCCFIFFHNSIISLIYIIIAPGLYLCWFEWIRKARIDQVVKDLLELRLEYLKNPKEFTERSKTQMLRHYVFAKKLFEREDKEKIIEELKEKDYTYQWSFESGSYLGVWNEVYSQEVADGLRSVRFFVVPDEKDVAIKICSLLNILQCVKRDRLGWRFEYINEDDVALIPMKEGLETVFNFTHKKESYKAILYEHRRESRTSILPSSVEVKRGNKIVFKADMHFDEEGLLIEHFGYVRPVVSVFIKSGGWYKFFTRKNLYEGKHEKK